MCQGKKDKKKNIYNKISDVANKYYTIIQIYKYRRVYKRKILFAQRNINGHDYLVEFKSSASGSTIILYLYIYLKDSDKRVQYRNNKRIITEKKFVLDFLADYLNNIIFFFK